MKNINKIISRYKVYATKSLLHNLQKMNRVFIKFYCEVLKFDKISLIFIYVIIIIISL